MHISEAIKIAFLSLWANKLRSALTLLGVVIGVAAVIAVVTFVNGINTYVGEKIFNLGADVFIIFKVSPAVTNVEHFIEGQRRKDLTMDDYRAVREGCQLCAYVGAYARNNTGHVKYGEQALSDTTVQGMTPAVAVTQDFDLDTGRMLTDSDIQNNSPVVVVGTDVVDNLLPGVDPLGKEIRIDGWIYRIVGVGKKKGTTWARAWTTIFSCLSILGETVRHATCQYANLRQGGGTGPILDATMDEARVIVRARRHDAAGPCRLV